MGLGIEVGRLADLKLNEGEDAAGQLRESFDQINAVLSMNGLPTHVEPETLPPLKSRAALQSYPYSFLHYLWRFAAYASANLNWQPQPFPESDDPLDDSILEGERDMLSSHLFCHSDHSGFYVPIDFDEPLFSDAANPVPGGILGSSQGLMRELVAIAPFLDISLVENQLADAEAERINARTETKEPFWIELAVWLSLFEAARLSIEHRTAICFT